MQFIIVTGMSGAGKSTAINHFEDMGYYCMDNLPPALIPNFLDLIKDKQDIYDKVVLGIDIRGGILFDELFNSLNNLINQKHEYQILFFDCQDDMLIKRYKETRRTHPISKNDRIYEGISQERKMLQHVKQGADYIIDTTYTLPKDVKEALYSMYMEKSEFKNLMITILIFGFKYGVPIDADLIFDVRFIPNPFYDQSLRPLTGNDQAVQDYVLQFDITNEFIFKLNDMIEFLLPNYMKEGKNQLVIGIGCTGGKHRSVVIGNILSKSLKENGYMVNIDCRDIDKDSKRGK
ncbi:RNase adaptor protein RapZ [Candidatus Epulonipiscium fishelsonii]|uniref:RNase adaptor protein RapZ n=1 Tax=Candidatus Epulonipiscium fishelsonii TaxID=77094 RepID=A0ACC8XF47_9FIRM|nr:RNase adaptor protein RapZ [Epulopiscium sp. SCG-B05WGA-EpuloA1]ONI41912.1 RNase adaptor protein RapZ [Epulopiscium sp. SCG-B11WGA-EpuloA1]ONI48042.1 RNase adaptor protein RapZ [Epulopiscium sp. SCG-C06WGA-EpuloA1]